MKRILNHLASFLFVLLSALLFLGLSACASAAPGGIEIDQAVVRLPGGSMAGMGELPIAAFMRIKNNGATDDMLMGIQADFAGKADIHETVIDSNGVASMKPIPSISVPAGQTVELKKGGLHTMFGDLKQELKAGDQVTLVLQFKNAGLLSVQAEVILP